MQPPLPPDEVRELVCSCLHRDPVAADLRCSLFVAAAQSYRRDSVLRPYPARYIRDTDTKEFDELLSDVSSLPGVRELVRLRPGEADHHLALTHWLLSSKSFAVKTLQKDEYVKLCNLTEISAAPHQYVKLYNLTEISAAPHQYVKLCNLKEISAAPHQYVKLYNLTEISAAPHQYVKLCNLTEISAAPHQYVKLYNLTEISAAPHQYVKLCNLTEISAAPHQYVKLCNLTEISAAPHQYVKLCNLTEISAAPHQYVKLCNLTESEGISTPVPDFLFELEYCDQMNVKFEKTRAGRDLLYAFHGSRLENFHSIIHNGLHCHLNKTSLFGEGTYLTSDLSMAVLYSPHGNGWRDSLLGPLLSCVAMCEVIDHPDVKCQVKRKDSETIDRQRSRARNSEGGEVPQKYFVVTNNQLLRVKYLLVYSQRRHLSRHSRGRSWPVRHHFAIMMSLYLLLLIFIGAFNSTTFLSFWNRLFR
ncbi:unnamed protein product [Coregonus sp. 'balchen']|nr:unnamed protein product [Coregonus sp. 'balchen']